MTTVDPQNYEFIAVAESDELPDNGRLVIEVDGLLIILVRIAGIPFAVADECSHDGNPLDDGDLDGYELVCPRHGARFDVRTGKVLCLPAVEDIPAYPVREVDGQIEIGLPLEE